MVKAETLLKSFDSPDEVRVFEKGRFELLHLGPMEIGRAAYEPGWKWSEHVGPSAGTPLCEVEHVGLVISGRAAVRMRDGSERILSAGTAFYVAPGHDSWVVGEEPYVSLHLMGAAQYASAKE
ncbi:MAG: cupin domain-containing protein [Acidobacteriota bacterium]